MSDKATDSADRPAQIKDEEVTPEMIAAGVATYVSWESDDWDGFPVSSGYHPELEGPLQALAREMWRSMQAARLGKLEETEAGISGGSKS